MLTLTNTPTSNKQSLSSEMRDACLAIIRRSPHGLTADEVARIIGANILSIRPRVSELSHTGNVVASATRRDSSNGNPQTVWIPAHNWVPTEGSTESFISKEVGSRVNAAEVFARAGQRAGQPSPEAQAASLHKANDVLNALLQTQSTRIKAASSLASEYSARLGRTLSILRGGVLHLRPTAPSYMNTCPAIKEAGLLRAELDTLRVAVATAPLPPVVPPPAPPAAATKPPRRYVVGLLFDRDTRKVALLRKRSTALFAASRWNGPGGSVEDGETPHAAMVREFREETGVQVESWQQFAEVTLKSGSEVTFFCAWDDRVEQVKTTTDEEVRVFSVWEVPVLATAGLLANNLAWMVAMLRAL